jgi:hypothetical protein
MAMKKSLLHSTKDTLIDAGVGLVGGGVIGSALGNYSLLAGLPLTVYGHYSDNRWARMLGYGLILSNGYQSANGGTAGLAGEEELYGAEGLEGFNLQNFQRGASARIGAYFRGFRRKLGLPAAAPAQAGTSGLGEDSVRYLANPFEGTDTYTTMAGSYEEPLPALQGTVLGSVGSLPAAGLSGLGTVW